jgi:hypothetical protein
VTTQIGVSAKMPSARGDTCEYSGCLIMIWSTYWKERNMRHGALVTEGNVFDSLQGLDISTCSWEAGCQLEFRPLRPVV